MDAGHSLMNRAGFSALRRRANNVEKLNYWVITFNKSTFNFLCWCS
jgi:hypothetical protein